MSTIWLLVVSACSSSPPEEEPPGDPTAVGGAEWRLHEAEPSIVVVQWLQRVDGPAVVQWRRGTEEWSEFRVPEAVAGLNSARVLGVPLGSTVSWQVDTPSGAVPGLRPIQATPAPPGLDSIRVEGDVNAGGWPDGALLLTRTFGHTSWVVLLNESGRVVWARSTGGAGWSGPVVSRSGTHLLYTEESASDDWELSLQITEVTLDGVQRSMGVPNGQEYIVELGDGRLAWTGYFGEVHTVRFDDPTPQVLWSCATDWPEGHGYDPYYGGYGLCEATSLVLDEQRDELVMAFPDKLAVVAIDAVDGSTRWWTGNVPMGLPIEPGSVTLDRVRVTGARGQLEWVTADGEGSAWQAFDVDEDALRRTDVRRLDTDSWGLHAKRQADGTLLTSKDGEITCLGEEGEVLWRLKRDGATFSEASWVTEPTQLLADP
ncbi:MAG: hypothetical protein KTR31_13510 [Myxococcales bacterium]|nr:hypothetical protein [Myxococcales bacterium]